MGQKCGRCIDVNVSTEPQDLLTIVAEIEAEQAVVAANRLPLRRMKAKVKAAIDRVWGKSVENGGYRGSCPMASGIHTSQLPN